MEQGQQGAPAVELARVRLQCDHPATQDVRAHKVCCRGPTPGWPIAVGWPAKDWQIVVGTGHRASCWLPGGHLQFTMALPDNITSKVGMVWSTLMPPEDMTAWLSVDLKR